MTRKRKRSVKDRLLVAQAELRGLRRVTQPNIGIPAFAWRKEGEPAPFVQLVAVSRGYASILHALDREGKVWELVSVFENKELKEQWWKKLEAPRKER